MDISVDDLSVGWCVGCGFGIGECSSGAGDDGPAVVGVVVGFVLEIFGSHFVSSSSFQMVSYCS